MGYSCSFTTSTLCNCCPCPIAYVDPTDCPAWCAAYPRPLVIRFSVTGIFSDPYGAFTLSGDTDFDMTWNPVGVDGPGWYEADPNKYYRLDASGGEWIEFYNMRILCSDNITFPPGGGGTPKPGVRTNSRSNCSASIDTLHPFYFATCNPITGDSNLAVIPSEHPCFSAYPDIGEEFGLFVSFSLNQLALALAEPVKNKNDCGCNKKDKPRQIRPITAETQKINIYLPRDIKDKQPLLFL